MGALGTCHDDQCVGTTTTSGDRWLLSRQGTGNLTLTWDTATPTAEKVHALIQNGQTVVAEATGPSPLPLTWKGPAGDYTLTVSPTEPGLMPTTEVTWDGIWIP